MLSNLEELLPEFRKTGGYVIWVKTQLEKTMASRLCDGIFTDEEADDVDKPRDEPGVKDTDAYLSSDFNTIHDKFLSGENADQYSPMVNGLIDANDQKLTKSEYSAFSIQSLLMFLRSRMVTELYLAGAHTNVSVYATGTDAARHGFMLNILNDCVVFRNEKRHDKALSDMELNLGADSITCAELLEKLGVPKDGKKTEKGAREEVSGTGMIRSPLVDPVLVEKLVQRLNDRTDTPETVEEDDQEQNHIEEKEIVVETIAQPVEQPSTDYEGVIAAPLMNEEAIEVAADDDEEEEDIDDDAMVEMLVAQTRKNLILKDYKRTERLGRIAKDMERKSSRTANMKAEEPSNSMPKIMDTTLPMIKSTSPTEESLVAPTPQFTIRKTEEIEDHLNSPSSEPAVLADEDTLSRREIKLPISRNNSKRKSSSRYVNLPTPVTTPTGNGLNKHPLSPLSPSKTIEQEVLESSIINLLDSSVHPSVVDESQPDEVAGVESLTSYKDSSLDDQMKQLSIGQENLVEQVQEANQSVSINSPQGTSEDQSVSRNSHGFSGHKKEKIKTKKNKHVNATLGPEDKIGEEGDSTSIMVDFLPEELASVAFDRMKTEVAWRVMYHRGGEVPRLVAVEGEIAEDGSFPIYRHPADESPPLLPFSPTVAEIRKHVEKALKHPVNHVLIQHYRTGMDYISEHSDKTLDIAQNSSIVNVSLGAQRTMTLRGKRTERTNGIDSKPPTDERASQKIPLPHNSMFVLGLETNKRWMHSINRDKRADNIKLPEELTHNGERISLTFRHITTFLSKDESRIWGQGAVNKTKDTAGKTICGDESKAQEMIDAFGAENRLSEFNWDQIYGAGFDVLHFKPQQSKLYIVRNDDGTIDTASQAIQIALKLLNVNFVEEVLSEDELTLPSFLEISPRCIIPVLVDVDRERSVVIGSEAILLYLATASETTRKLVPTSQAAYATVLADLMFVGQLRRGEDLAITNRSTRVVIRQQLKMWDEVLGKRVVEHDKLEGKKQAVTIFDCAFSPVLYRMMQTGMLGSQRSFSGLRRYLKAMMADDNIQQVLTRKELVEEDDIVDDDLLENKVMVSDVHSGDDEGHADEDWASAQEDA